MSTSLPTSQPRGAFFSECLGDSRSRAVGKGAVIYQEPTKYQACNMGDVIQSAEQPWEVGPVLQIRKVEAQMG